MKSIVCTEIQYEKQISISEGRTFVWFRSLYIWLVSCDWRVPNVPLDIMWLSGISQDRPSGISEIYQVYFCSHVGITRCGSIAHIRICTSDGKRSMSTINGFMVWWSKQNIEYCDITSVGRHTFDFMDNKTIADMSPVFPYSVDRLCYFIYVTSNVHIRRIPNSLSLHCVLRNHLT